MEIEKMHIDHIGIVVKDIQKGIDHWEKIFGYTQMTKVVINSRQKVKVVFLKKEDSLLVKLIEPSAEDSPIFMYARKGGGLHHLCFKCEDMQTQLDLFKSQGIRVLAEPQPGEAFENEDIAFLYAKHGMNIELIDTDKKAEIL